MITNADRKMQDASRIDAVRGADLWGIALADILFVGDAIDHRAHAGFLPCDGLE